MKKISREKPSSHRWSKLWLKRLLLIPLGILALILNLLAQNQPELTERLYSQTIYPKLVEVVGFLPSLTKYSVAEWLVLFFALFCLGFIFYSAVQIVKQKGQRWQPLYRGVSGLVAIFCGVYFIFTILCGPNYYRKTFTEQAGYDLSPPTTEEIQVLCQKLAAELVEAKNQVATSAIEGAEFDYFAKKAVQAMKTLGKDYPILTKVDFSQPKGVRMSKVMSYGDITGIFMPFTMEANLNQDVPFFTVPATMAHELVHQAGFMREDEANFLAYLACKKSTEPLLVYSGYFSAFTHGLAALQKNEPAQATRIKEALPKAVKQDLAQYRNYWRQHGGLFADLSSSLNDLYLKANRQTDGTASYNRMVILLVAEMRERT